MITPMIKYSLVLYHKEYDAFLANLQELGLVDITTSVWEPSPEERVQVAMLEKYRQGIAELRKMDKTGDKSFKSVEEAFQTYEQAKDKINKLSAQLSKTDKEIEELRPWGKFSVDQIEQLKNNGINIYFYSLFNKEFDNAIEEWRGKYAVEQIYRDNTNTYFVVIVPEDQILDIDAQPIKAPKVNFEQKIEEKKAIENELKIQNELIGKVAPYVDEFEEQAKSLSNMLQLSKVAQSGERQAEGTLIVLEGWATKDSQPEVDKMLDSTGAFYIKSEPTEDDETPVLLKNNKFISLFETIGEFYALPKYGTTDLTPYYGPFYALFFGFCLGDAGYGAIYVLVGLLMALKMKKTLATFGWLVVCGGIGSIIFGLLTGNIFGIQLANLKAFSGMKDIFFDSNKLFYLALGIGIVHLLFAMSIKIVGISKRTGFKYALAPLGWMIVIISTLAALLLPSIGLSEFNMSSTPYYIVLGIGLFLMLFMNSPGKNPLINLGSGIWNTYNDLTGILSDVLSYVRLFAICLSGGVLALVFNDLALGLSPDIPVIKQLVMVIILLIGHGINLFMSTLSSFVHPMRLTFVEFYKNAGFEAVQRKFTPLKKIK